MLASGDLLDCCKGHLPGGHFLGFFSQNMCDGALSSNINTCPELIYFFLQCRWCMLLLPYIVSSVVGRPWPSMAQC